MATFAESARQGDVANVFKLAVINGALWAVGIAWSTAIREIALIVLPEDTPDAVLAELLAAGVVSVLGVTVALAAGRTWCRSATLASSSSAPAAPARGSAPVARRKRPMPTPPPRRR